MSAGTTLGQRASRWTAGLFVGLLAIFMLTGIASGQAERVKTKGKVLSVAPGSIMMSDAGGKTYTFKIPKTSNVIQVVGNLSLDKLRPGTIVRFSGKLKGAAGIEGEVSKLTVYSPVDGYQQGILLDDPAQDAVITGQVSKIAKNMLTVSAGRKRMTVKLADNVEIAVDSKDYSIAKAGDAIEGEGTVGGDGSVAARKVVVTVGGEAAGATKSEK